MKSLLLKNKIPKQYYILGCILIYAFILRMLNITERGLLHYDEAWYANEAKSIIYGLKYFLNHLSNFINGTVDFSEFRSYVISYSSSIAGSSGKIFFNILSSVSAVLFGNVMVGMSLLSIGFNVASCLMVYLISRHIFKDETVSLVAAFVFSVSSISIWYARSPLSQSMSVFFVLLATYVIFGSNHNRKILVIAISLALGILCHPNILPSVALIGLIIFIGEIYTEKASVKSIAKVMLVLLLVIVIAVYLFGLISKVPYFLVGGNSEVISSQIDNTDVILRRSRTINAFSIELFLDFVAKSVVQLINSEGILVLFFSIGLIWACYSKIQEANYKAMLLVLLPLIVILIWAVSCVHFRDRLLYQVYPFIAMSTAYGIIVLFRFLKTNILKSKKIVIALVICLSLYCSFTGIIRSKKIASISNLKNFMQLKVRLDTYVGLYGGNLIVHQGHLFPQIAYFFARDNLKGYKNLENNIIRDGRKISQKQFPFNHGDFVIIPRIKGNSKELFGTDTVPDKHKMNLLVEKNNPVFSIPYTGSEGESPDPFTFNPNVGTFDVYDLRMIGL